VHLSWPYLKTGDNHVVFIDEMEVTEDGKLIVHEPTTGGEMENK